MPSLNRFTVPVARVAGPKSYAGLTDCQICVMESLKIDGPCSLYDLQPRINRELVVAGVPYRLFFSLQEITHAVSGLLKSQQVAQSVDLKLHAQLDLPGINDGN